MSILGIIAEYNPFHNGHFYHLSISKSAAAAEYVVVLMNGNFTQRGEPTIIDKYGRTSMALASGADIVIELPLMYATASAEIFADAGIHLLNATGVITHISFGSESGDLDYLSLIAGALSSEEINQRIHLGMSKGLPYFSAVEQSLSSLRIDHDFINKPNNILAIEYLKALHKTHSSIVPITIERLSNTLKASDLRDMIFNDNLREAAEYMPQTAGSILRNTLEQCGSTDFSRLDEILRYKLITMDTEDIKKILDMNDGVAERFKKYCVNACNSAELLEMVKTKRHAYTRLKRAALHLLLNIKTADFLETPNPPYIRVLGFRKSAERLLSKMIFSASLPVLAGLKNAEQKLSSSAHTMLRKEIESTDIFYLSCGNKKNTFELNQEYRKGIIIV